MYATICTRPCGHFHSTAGFAKAAAAEDSATSEVARGCPTAGSMAPPPSARCAQGDSTSTPGWCAC
eukprot:4671015-Pleurochrysis_carterae.AAC.2